MFKCLACAVFCCIILTSNVYVFADGETIVNEYHSNMVSPFDNPIPPGSVIPRPPVNIN